jgi:hypothetical protein
MRASVEVFDTDADFPERLVSRPFDEDEDELEDVGPEVLDPSAPLPLLPPIGGEVEEEVWDEADFDDEFDDDFDDEPDEDLERFEKELNDEDIEADKEIDGDFDEDDEI